MAAIPASQQTQHQTHGGAGISAIEHLRGLLQPIKTNPLHGDGFTSLIGLMVTPIALRQAAVLIGSSAGNKPSIVVCPSAMAPNSNARCEMDLSPESLT